jgi:UDP-N-acetylmuramyl pentapeptide phosphotransferase/UDP-N-acetylglucosamine-1-phosphate transferase
MAKRKEIRRFFRQLPKTKEWAENKIIVRFWIAGAMLALIALSTLKIQ